METWQTHHVHAENEYWTCVVTWRWSQRRHDGGKLPRGTYRAKVTDIQFSAFTPEVEQLRMIAWLSER